MHEPAIRQAIHPRFSRRAALQAGAIGLLGLGTNHVAGLRTAQAASGELVGDAPAKSVIFIFLSGGLSQLESFDMKPEAPEGVRGEFRPIATRTSGIDICEHLPGLAQRSQSWSLVRSLTHPYNEHSQGHMVMLSGRTELPAGFDANRPKSTDWPSIAAVTGDVAPRRTNNLPPAVVLPERLVHRTGRVIPGQFAGLMSPRRDPWFIESCRFNPISYGAWPEYGFHFERGGENPADFAFEAPSLALPADLARDRFRSRLQLLQEMTRQQALLEASAESQSYDRHRQNAISLLADPKVRRAFDVVEADAATQERYGRNVFGWSLLMARRLVEAGVGLVQVNLGNNESWDTHQNMFPVLRDYLFPPTDRALSALLDDLQASGQMSETLIVVAGEFGRTPRISTLPGAKQPGRDHWGAVQTVLLAGGGIQGGIVVGSSDKDGGRPRSAPQTPENLAATIYQQLGLPRTVAWHDDLDRPHHVYHGAPIAGLV